MDNRAALARLATHSALLGRKGAANPAALADADLERKQSEMQRVHALARWVPEELAHLDLTEQYRKEGGSQNLRLLQTLSLHWLQKKRGLVAPLGVGVGKGLLAMLAPRAVRAERPLLLLPAKLVDSFHREYRKFRDHWRVSQQLKVVTYSQLSVSSGADILMSFRPDLIICDEAHAIARPSSTRAKRLLRYFEQFPETMAVFMSGTLTKRGLRDYAHFCELALGEYSPLPLNVTELLAWANCIDSDGVARESDWQTVSMFMPPGWEAWHDGDPDKRDAALRTAARGGFQSRFRSTPGVVGSSESAVGTALYFHERTIKVPPEVEQARLDLDRTWCRPDGEELASALEKYNVEKQMSCGFFYVWDWPGGVVDVEWMMKRAAWHKAVRRVLKDDHPEWDSPMRVANAIRNGRVHMDTTNEVPEILEDDELCHAYDAWCGVKDRPQPPTKTIWLSKFLVNSAVQWAIERLEKGEAGIIWYEDSAVARALAEAGLPVYGRGTDPEAPGTPPMLAASILVHGTGKNLQAWSKNLVMSWPSGGDTAQQLIGRTHRPLQPADEVEFAYFAHTRQARNALRRSHGQEVYVKESQGEQRKMLMGTWVNPTWMGDEEPDEEAT